MIYDTDTIDQTHIKIRETLIKYGSQEYGDIIIDEICEIFNYPKTPHEEEN